MSVHYHVHLERAERLFKHMNAAQLDQCVDAEMKFDRDGPGVSDLALYLLDLTETDLSYELLSYEPAVERHWGTTVIHVEPRPERALGAVC